MTRETRVGLLLGLIFIIAFGMVLSELNETGLQDGKQSTAPIVPTDSHVHVQKQPPLEPVAYEPPSFEPVRRVAEAPRRNERVEAPVATRTERPRRTYMTASILRDRPERRETAPQPRISERREVASGYREVSIEELPDHIRRNNRDRAAARNDSARAARPGRVYVVKSGDNLHRIARKMLNSSSKEAVNKIFNANRDKLNNPNNLRAGMRLRIPS